MIEFFEYGSQTEECGNLKVEGILKKNEHGCSSFKTTLYGINIVYECLQNNLALMALCPMRYAIPPAPGYTLRA
jgi:hypothetical protein